MYRTVPVGNHIGLAYLPGGTLGITPPYGIHVYAVLKAAKADVTVPLGLSQRLEGNLKEATNMDALLLLRGAYLGAAILVSEGHTSREESARWLMTGHICCLCRSY